MTATTETAVTRPVLVASSPVRAGGGVQELYYCPSGWYVAGAGVRWQDGDRWLSTCERGGASHGAYFTDEIRAREHFAARAILNTWETV
jgi:hypothetical protein